MPKPVCVTFVEAAVDEDIEGGDEPLNETTLQLYENGARPPVMLTPIEPDTVEISNAEKS